MGIPPNGLLSLAGDNQRKTSVYVDTKAKSGSVNHTRIEISSRF